VITDLRWQRRHSQHAALIVRMLKRHAYVCAAFRRREAFAGLTAPMRLVKTRLIGRADAALTAFDGNSDDDLSAGSEHAIGFVDCEFGIKHVVDDRPHANDV
jgi:hypothetical protein